MNTLAATQMGSFSLTDKLIISLGIPSSSGLVVRILEMRFAKSCYINSTSDLSSSFSRPVSSMPSRNRLINIYNVFSSSDSSISKSVPIFLRVLLLFCSSTTKRQRLCFFYYSTSIRLMTIYCGILC